MIARKLRTIAIAVIAIGSLTVSLAIRQRTQSKIEQKEMVLRGQADRLRELTDGHWRLMNLMTNATNSMDSVADERTAELAKLRSEAEALRRRIEELSLTNKSHAQTDSTSNYSTDHRVRKVVSENGSEEYRLRLYAIGAADPHSEPPANIDMMKDAQNLAQAVRTYARQHHGDLPANFDLAAAYFYKEYRAPRVSEFELVYQGSSNDFTNIPEQAVALVRERQAWPTPGGKWGRIYFMANGMMKLVESDDNFRSWEAEHVIPAQAQAD